GAGARDEVRTETVAAGGGGGRFHPVLLEKGIADEERRLAIDREIGGRMREGVAAVVADGGLAAGQFLAGFVVGEFAERAVRQHGATREQRQRSQFERRSHRRTGRAIAAARY